MIMDMNTPIAAIEGIRFTVIPIECLEEIKADIQVLSAQYELNDFQREIVNDLYVLDPPLTEFDIKSLVVAVWQLSIARATFHYRGQRASCIVDDSFTPATDVYDRLSRLFASNGHALEQVTWMPLKRLAVRSGLCEYGRNNITYSGDWGSFIRLGAYVSNAPAENYVWREVKSLDVCSRCGKCIANCPTGAILPNRFLIDNVKCLTYHNDSDRAIPDWMPKSAHHCLVECTRCQEICPLNSRRLANLETIELTEAETDAMLKAGSFLDFPDSVREKLWHYDTGEPFKFLPRNLRLMLDNLLGTEN